MTIGNPNIKLPLNGGGLVEIRLSPSQFSELGLMRQNAQKKSRDLYVEFGLIENSKSAKQVRTVWALCELAYMCENPSEYTGERKPCRDDVQDMYDAFIEAYGFTKKVRANMNGVPFECEMKITLSKMTMYQATLFITRILEHLSGITGRKDVHDEAIKVKFEEFQAWIGSMSNDPLDYRADGVTPISLSEFRELHTVSQASGGWGPLHRHHIMTKGSTPRATDVSWNWVMLTHEEHRAIHDAKKLKVFLDVYPHLRGRFERARKMAQELDRGCCFNTN